MNAPAPLPKSERLRLIALFGTLYFIQGVAEPTEGLIAQPVRSLLESWGHTAEQIGRFMLLLAVPWFIKPLYGLLTDLVPLFGSRRISYLIIMSLVSASVLICMNLFPIPHGAASLLLLLLVLPTVAIAFSDVVTDALLVEKGQATGMTGQLQSAQWTAIYGATILTGFVGGWLSQHGKQRLGFLICGSLSVITFLLAATRIREPRATLPAQPGGDIGQQPASTVEPPVEKAGRARGRFREALTSPVVIGIGGFLFLWNFNPFANATLDYHMTRTLGYDEQFYGTTVSYLAVASAAASVLYGLYCRKIPMRVLLHLSVLLGIVSTLSYWGLTRSSASAITIAVVVGFTYMTATLIQLDLAARLCPPHLAATVFALLMSLSNFSLAMATWFGGTLYTRTSDAWGPERSFQVLVGIGGICTASCWLLVPFLSRAVARYEAAAASFASEKHPAATS